MRIIIILSFFLFWAASLSAQTYITQSCETCDYNSALNKYENCRTEALQGAFKLDLANNVFVHSDGSAQNTFRINRKNTNNEGQTYEVSDEAGNSYLLMVANDAISIVPLKNGKPSAILIRYKRVKN